MWEHCSEASRLRLRMFTHMYAASCTMGLKVAPTDPRSAISGMFAPYDSTVEAHLHAGDELGFPGLEGCTTKLASLSTKISW